MSYTTAQARERIIRELGLAASQIGLALDYLSEAYEQVDANLADQLEEKLFAPVQAAYARARRTATEFVSRHALAERDGSLPAPPSRPHGAAALIDAASQAVERADQWIGELQDSMLPVEVGDEALRAGLSDTRSLLSALPARARELVRILGR